MRKYHILQLKKNRKFGTLPLNEQKTLINDAIKIGKDTAEMAHKVNKTRNVEKIARGFGIDIVSGQNGCFGAVQLMGSYDHRSKKISLYDNKYPSVSRNYVIGHELFHYYENEHNIYQKFSGLSEISAYHFSKQLIAE